MVSDCVLISGSCDPAKIRMIIRGIVEDNAPVLRNSPERT